MFSEYMYTNPSETSAVPRAHGPLGTRLEVELERGLVAELPAEGAVGAPFEDNVRPFGGPQVIGEDRPKEVGLRMSITVGCKVLIVEGKVGGREVLLVVEADGCCLVPLMFGVVVGADFLFGEGRCGPMVD